MILFNYATLVGSPTVTLSLTCTAPEPALYKALSNPTLPISRGDFDLPGRLIPPPLKRKNTTIPAKRMQANTPMTMPMIPPVDRPTNKSETHC